MRRGALIVAGAMLALTPPACASVRQAEVHLSASGPKPSVVTVPPGAKVRWVNEDSVAHTLRGQVSSTAIPPGGSFAHRFARIGEYRYHDAANEALRGTVIVSAGGASKPPPPSSHGLVRHRFSAVVTLRDRESYRFYDDKYHGLKGPCNGEVGEGSRKELLKVRFPSVTYTGVGGTEVVVGQSAHAKVAQRELVDADAARDDSPLAPCPDGTTEPGPSHHVHCERQGPLPAGGFRLGWTPAAKNRFQLTPTGQGRTELCGLAYVGPLGLAGVDPESLPLFLVPNRFAYDSATAGPLTRGELEALRHGRRLSFRRELSLSWLDTCCTAWVPPDFGGVLARVGTAWTWDASLKIELKPR